MKKNYYPKINAEPLSQQEIIDLDNAYGWSRKDIMKRLRTSYKKARQLFKAVQKEKGTLPFFNSMVRREDVIAYIKIEMKDGGDK